LYKRIFRVFNIFLTVSYNIEIRKERRFISRIQQNLKSFMRFQDNSKKSNYKEKRKMSESTQFEKKWWKDLNELCLKCKKSCKQSSKAMIVECPSFEKKDGETIRKENSKSKRSKYGHLLSCITGKIDKLIEDGQNRNQIKMLLHIDDGRLDWHLKQLKKKFGVEIEI